MLVLDERSEKILRMKWLDNAKTTDVGAIVGTSKSTISRTLKKYADKKDELMNQWQGGVPNENAEDHFVKQALQDEPVRDVAAEVAIAQGSDSIDDVPHFVSTDVVTVYVDGKMHSFDHTHPNYQTIRDATMAKDWEAVSENADYAKVYKKLTFGFFEITEHGTLLHNGEECASELVDTIIELNEKDVKPYAILKFMERLKSNPSVSSVESAIRFITNNKLPIDKDGFLLAYKSIKSDWTDKYTGTIDNSIGSMPAMKREDVNQNPGETCSTGLHVCSESYLSVYTSDRVVVCRIDPQDICSVPHDYNNAKMRVMRYEVIHELVDGARIPDNFIDDTCDWYK